MDHEGFIGAVGVDANPAVVKNGIGELRPLPEHVAVALKLARVGGLRRDGKGGRLRSSRSETRVRNAAVLLGRGALRCRET